MGPSLLKCPLLKILRIHEDQSRDAGEKLPNLDKCVITSCATGQEIRKWCLSISFWWQKRQSESAKNLILLPIGNALWQSFQKSSFCQFEIGSFHRRCHCFSESSTGSMCEVCSFRPILAEKSEARMPPTDKSSSWMKGEEKVNFLSTFNLYFEVYNIFFFWNCS